MKRCFNEPRRLTGIQPDLMSTEFQAYVLPKSTKRHPQRLRANTNVPASQMSDLGTPRTSEQSPPDGPIFLWDGMEDQ
jgi:hypothetical protein